MQNSKNRDAFISLVRAGLWETEVPLLPYGEIDFYEIHKLAQEQSVVGLIAAGLEHVIDVRVPKEIVLSIAGEVIKIEQRNSYMNSFIGILFEQMVVAGFRPVLVKGQGIAQCYERPLWRASGDIDVLLNEKDYDNIYSFLKPLSSSHEDELKKEKHQVFIIDPWVVEIHGNMPSRLLHRIDVVIDEAQKDTFINNNVRAWPNSDAIIMLPAPNNDVIFVFSHILKHFFRGGIGLRQICDWCRLLWNYRDSIDDSLLEKRIKAAGLLSEWKAFASLGVNMLGMPEAAMPLYSSDVKWYKKAVKIMACIIETGNFGHNRDYGYLKYPTIIRRTISLLRNSRDSIRHLSIFPLDSIRIWLTMLNDGVFKTVKGKQ